MSYNSKYTGARVEKILDSVESKQDKLVSGTNIKTINGQSIVGSGDITISGGGGDYLPLTGGTITGDLTLTDGPGGAGNFQSYTVDAKEFFSDIYYLERNGEHAVIMGNNKVEIINGIEQTKASIDWSGDGTKFLSNDGTYKTISGGGGSSSGSGAYSEVNHGTSDTTFTLTPNTFHVWDEVSALTLTLGSETSGVANEFLFQFTSGATATSLTLPDDIKWANDSAPTIAENMIYQVSILKGLASVLEFKNTGDLIENKLTITSNGTAKSTFTFEYPVTSDVTLQYSNTFGGNYTAIIEVGAQSAVTEMAPGNENIVSVIISPSSDNTYIYTR